ncbi:MAG: hypothetical protein QOF60_2475 [Actinomycetota bacterium]|jgi:hypothetical protein|nr:hypothetical protein [Actinomycetota bacterium]
MNEDAGTPPVYPKSARPRGRAWLAVVSLAALLGGLFALSPLAPASADSPSGYCSDPYESPRLQLFDEHNNFGLPLWLGIESGAQQGPPGLVRLCYGTGAPGDSKTAGGAVGVVVQPWSNGVSVEAGTGSDTNAANQTNAGAYAWPTYSLSPGGANGGQALSLWIPFAVCSGPCQPSVQPADQPSGVIVGTIQQAPPPAGGTSAAYSVTSLCLKVDGATVAGNCSEQISVGGVTTTGTNPVTSAPATPGPCVLTACAPNFTYLGTTRGQLATVYVPLLGPIPVFGVHTCLYRNDTNTVCPD